MESSMSMVEHRVDRELGAKHSCSHSVADLTESSAAEVITMDTISDDTLKSLVHQAGANERPIRRLFVRPAEAAVMLSISRAKLYELLLSGELRSVTIGRVKRVPLAALQALAK